METPMIKKLRELLATMTQEEFERDWAAIKAKGLKGPTVREFIASFRLPPAYQASNTEAFQTEAAEIHLSFNVEDNISYALAA